MAASVREIRLAKKETQEKHKLLENIQQVEYEGSFVEMLKSILTEENTDLALDLLDQFVDFPGPDWIWKKTMDQFFPDILLDLILKLASKKLDDSVKEEQNAQEEESQEA